MTDYIFWMWRSKSNQFKTANLCNQFLVVQLNKKKLQHERIGMERKAMVYQTAIASIKKYPLPIICMQQLRSLYGVGEQLCEELIKIIKNHYQAFMRENQGGHVGREGTVQSDLGEEELELTQTKSVSFNELNQNKKGQHSQYTQEDDSKSTYSFKSTTMKPYKPRPKTQGAYVLLTISKLSSTVFISRDELSEQLKQSHNTKLTGKALSLILQNLLKSGYIESQSPDFGRVKIAEKGERECECILLKTKEKDSSIKVKSILSSFLSSKVEKQDNSGFQMERSQKRELKVDDEGEVCLLVDTREMKDKQEQSFFQKRMVEKYGVKVRTCNLPIGDFMWQYRGQILDYVMERKKADDLISSIFDGRYKEQKYRLKNSDFSNIYYLSQGHLTGNYAKNERELSSALLRTRINDQFKVVQVNNITESTKFIYFLTQEIQKKIISQKRATVLGTLEEVTVMYGKSNQLTVEHIFGLSLKTIPGVGKAAVSEVLKHFRCFRELYDKLEELGDRFERVEFLKELMKGGGVRGGLGEALVGVMFEIN